MKHGAIALVTDLPGFKNLAGLPFISSAEAGFLGGGAQIALSVQSK
jgi:hypothetical protein